MRLFLTHKNLNTMMSHLAHAIAQALSSHHPVFDRFAVCKHGGGERGLVKDRKGISSNVTPSAGGWNVHKASLFRMPYGMVNVTKYSSRSSSLNLGMH